MKYLVYFAIGLATWTVVVEGFYHEKSMQILKSKNIAENALFGFSIAYQPKGDRLIVSAPRADAVGKVYACLHNTDCKEIISHKIKTTEAAPLTDMWLGASVATGSNFTVACAPRAIRNASETILKTGTFGRCFVGSDDVLDERYIELKTLNISLRVTGKQVFEEYMNSFGWAINIDRRDSIIVGGPAMYKGRAIVYSSIEDYPKSLKFWPSPIKYNFGYSVTSGNFLSNNVNDILYATSSPYGQYGKGVVILSKYGSPASWPLQNTRDYSPPVGSLFGASLCSAKLLGAGQREALLVGAPLYATNGMVDVGAVYIYQYDPAMSALDFSQQIVHHKTILGMANRGQFGSAIINLGDINGDNRDDVAISAPYENEGRGAVYIYSADVILGDDPADKIRYLQRLQPGYHTFGFSMTSRQLSNKSCKDLAIGAPESNAVLLYQCIPKIVVRVLTLKENRRSKKNNTLFQYESCIDAYYPNKPSVVKAEIVVKVTLTHPTARIENSEKDGSMKYTISTSIFSVRKKQHCHPVNIVLPEEGSSPIIQYQVSATQIKPPTETNYFDNSHFMVSDVSTLTLTDTLWVADCASDNKCVPVLTFSVDTTMRDGYIIGSSESEVISVSVHNKGDPAYAACVRIVSSDVAVRRWPAGCERNDRATGTCRPNRPIRNETSWNTGNIKLEMNNLKSDLKGLIFTVYLYEECFETVPKNSTKMIKLSTDPQGLVVRGFTNFGDIIYLSSVEVSETGKQLSHIYTVSNSGFTTWVNIRCTIILDKKSYFKGMIVTIDSQSTYKCEEHATERKGRYQTECVVSELMRSQKFDVIVSIYMEPKTVEWKTLDKENVTLTSYIQVNFGEKKIDYSITNVLRKKEAVVPLWVIIVAALVGLLILFIIAFALYECGFLRRKKKEKLEKLKRSVHRQSMRRSAMERGSRSSANKALDHQSDENKLISESEDSEPSSPSVSTESCPPIPERVKKPPRITSQDMPPKPARLEEMPSNIEEMTPPPIPAEGEIIKKELIILGLQKNLGKYPVKPPKRRPQPQEMSEDQDKKEDIL